MRGRRENSIRDARTHEDLFQHLLYIGIIFLFRLNIFRTIIRRIFGEIRARHTFLSQTAAAVKEGGSGGGDGWWGWASAERGYSVRPETRGREDACCFVGAFRTRGRANISLSFPAPMLSGRIACGCATCACVYAAECNVVCCLTCSNKHRDRLRRCRTE